MEFDGAGGAEHGAFGAFSALAAPGGVKLGKMEVGRGACKELVGWGFKGKENRMNGGKRKNGLKPQMNIDGHG